MHVPQHSTILLEEVGVDLDFPGQHLDRLPQNFPVQLGEGGNQ